MSKEYTITVHTIAEDGLPPSDYEAADLIGRVAFLFDGNLYCGWPLNRDDDPEEIVWQDSETAHQFAGVKKWIELPVAGWKL
jgi:hypothetical protein